MLAFNLPINANYIKLYMVVYMFGLLSLSNEKIFYFKAEGTHGI